MSKKYIIGKQKTDNLRSYLGNLIRSNKDKKQIIWALDNLNFKVNQGEILGIIGPNGSGKSTLLKILSKITYPTKGYAKIWGRVSSLLEVGTGFHPELTGRENIFLNGTIIGMQRTEIKRQLDEIIDFSGVEKFIDTPVKHFSSGMYVRLAFSIAAHLHPEILLVDEILSVGDINFRNKSLGKMNAVAKQGKTVLMVSHNLGIIKNICTQGIYLDQGSMKYYSNIIDMIKDYTDVHETNQLRLPMDNSSFSNFSIQLIDTHKNETTVFQAGDNLICVLIIESNKNFENLNFRIDGLNENGERVFLCSNYLTGEMIKVTKGKNQVICKINNLALNIGKYTLNITVKDKNQILHSLKNAAYFLVYEGTFYKSGKMPAKDINTLIDHFWGNHV